MHHFVTRLVNKAIERSQHLRVEKLKIKSNWLPDIAISRDPGSGGKIIATIVAKKLERKLFDKNIMKKLSSELNIPANELVRIDEHGRTWISDLFNSIFNPDYVSDVLYISQLKKLLLHAAKQDDLVILGRGANLILPQNKCLRVRITASLATRINNTYKFEKFTTKREATEHIKRVENARNTFIRQYFGANPHNPWHYDLVICTDNLTVNQAASIIIHAFHAKFPKAKKSLSSTSAPSGTMLEPI